MSPPAENSHAAKRATGGKHGSRKSSKNGSKNSSLEPERLQAVGREEGLSGGGTDLEAGGMSAAMVDITPIPSSAPSTLPSGRITGTPSQQQPDKFSGSLPDRLQFLLSPACNPDLNEPAIMKQGNIRPEVQALKGPNRVTAAGRRLQVARNIVNFVVSAWPVQAVVMGIIMFDLILTIVSFTDEDAGSSRVGDWIVVIVLSLDVSGRWFVQGKKFLKSKLNLFELVLVPLTFIEVIFLADVNAPVPILRALRPIFRVIRVVRILVRTAGKGRGYLLHLRHTVSGDRIRFIQDGFDLDVAYITNQIIAMSMPAVGADALYLNNYVEVARLLNEKHGNQYLMVNTNDEKRGFSNRPFFDRSMHFPIAKDSVPQIDDLLQLCQDLDAWLRHNPENIIAVYSRHGQGRCSLVILALLIYRGERGVDGGGFDSVPEVIQRYQASRVDANDAAAYLQTLDSQSQHRFLEYFALLVYAGNKAPPRGRSVRLKRVQITGLPNSNQIYMSCFQMQDSAKGLRRHAYPKPGHLAGYSAQVTSLSQEQETEEPELDTKKGEEKALATSGYRQLMMSVQRHIDEATMDSRRAGTKPLTTEPILSSQAGHPTVNSGKIRCLSNNISSSELLAPVVFEIPNTELAGEIRIELHRDNPSKRRGSGGSNQQEQVPKSGAIKEATVGAVTRATDVGSEVKRLVFRIIACLLCCCSRKSKKPMEVPRFKEGMIMATSLHCDFLELNEFVQDGIPARMKNNKKISIVLDGRTIDKGVDAPPLRSYSSMFKVMLEFEVDKRVEWKAIAEEGFNEHHSVLAHSGSRSEKYDLGWLTWVSERIWPSFQSGLEKLIRENIMPNLEESLPSALGVRLAQCNFGTEFPHFKEVAASSRDHDGLEVQLDISFSYHPVVNIVIDTNLASFGISGLRIEGILALKFKPILDTLPVFAALQLHFLNRPNLDMKFSNQLAVANFNLIKTALFGVVNKAIERLMVLPNVICINWGDVNNDDTVSFREIFPASVIRVGIVQAMELKHESLFRRVPETFVKVQIGGQSAKTTVKTALTPVWRENFDFLVYDDRQEIECIMCDVDITQRSRQTGKVKHTTVAEMVAAGEDGKCYSIQADGTTGVVGKLEVKVEQYNLVANANEISEYLCISQSGDLGAWSDDEGSGGEMCDTESFEDDAKTCSKTMVGLSGTSVGKERASTTASHSPPMYSGNEGGAVIMLAVQLQGGRATSEDLKAGLKIQVKLGKKREERWCKEAPKVQVSTMGEKAQKSIERLGYLGLDENQIAEALQEDIEEVKHVIRRYGWNIEMNQKIILLLRPSECVHLTNIKVSMLRKSNRVVAEGSVPLRRIVRSPRCRHSEVLKCRPVGGSAIDLDMEFRLYSVVPKPVGNEISRAQSTHLQRDESDLHIRLHDNERVRPVAVDLTVEEDADENIPPADEMPTLPIPPSLVTALGVDTVDPGAGSSVSPSAGSVSMLV